MSFRIRVSPLEKEYVFEELDQYGIGYVKEEVYIYYCTVCDKTYRAKQDKCSEEDCDNTEIAKVQIGDIIGWNYNYVIERKKESDLLSSLSKNRLYHQLRNMKEFVGTNCALVFEGRFEDVIRKEKARIKKLIAKGFPRKVIMGANARLKQLMSIPATCCQYGVSFIQVKDLHQLLDMLKYFDYKCGEDPQIKPKRISIAKDLPKFLRLLMGIDGVGLKYAGRIYEQYKNTPQLTHALVTGELHNRVKGIGVKREELIRKWFGV